MYWSTKVREDKNMVIDITRYMGKRKIKVYSQWVLIWILYSKTPPRKLDSSLPLNSQSLLYKLNIFLLFTWNLLSLHINTHSDSWVSQMKTFTSQMTMKLFYLIPLNLHRVSHTFLRSTSMNLQEGKILIMQDRYLVQGNWNNLRITS